MEPLSNFLRNNSAWLGAGFLLTFASSFGQTFFLSVFAGEIRAEFGLSHGGWGGIYALATATSAAVMIWAGSLTDRFRIRHIGVVILLGLALTAGSMVWVSSVWGLVIVIFLSRLFGQGLMGHCAMVAMARWFVARRGRAVSIAGLGVAAGEALLPISFVALMGVVDWRLLWLVAAGVLLAFVPVLWTLLQRERTPQSHAEDSGSFGIAGRMWTRAQVLRHPVFWLMLPALFGPAAWNTSFFFQQVPLAEAKGWEHLQLVALFPLFTVSSVAFMLVAGGLVDRLGSGRLAGVYLIPLAVGYLVFALAQSLPAGAVGMILMGIGTGLHVTMMGTFWAEAFGTRHIGAIRAMMVAFMVLGTAMGPALTGVLIDVGISFPQQSFAISLYFLGASLLAGIAGRSLTANRAGAAA
ncbi:MAG: MFS transporter [Natronohydrobacter sp.]|nr:MFS transporter [Natronohydrobacter sp.]